MTKPNFLVVGAAKSGTTTLHNLLSQHPEVYMPERKEPCYFAARNIAGLEDFREYLALFEGSENQLARGEATVSYLYDKSSPRRIREELGAGVKIVIMLRNPVDMMYSLWGHMRRVQREKLDFIEALEAEPDRMALADFSGRQPGWPCDLFYPDRARYAVQVERYLEVFGAESVAVWIYEEFFSSASTAIAEIYRFIGVNDLFRPDEKRLNVAGVTRYGFLHRALNNSFPGKDFAKGVLGESARRTVKIALNRLNRKDQSLPALDDHQRSLAWSFVEEDVRKLDLLLGRRLSESWAPGATPR